MSDPVGEDGLLEPTEFTTPRWFVVLLALAVALCVAGGVLALA